MEFYKGRWSRRWGTGSSEGSRGYGVRGCCDLGSVGSNKA